MDRDAQLLHAARVVQARGFTWRIRRVERHAACHRIELAPQVPAGPPPWRVLLVPADRVEPAKARSRWRETTLSGAARELALRTLDTTLVGRVALQPALALVPWQAAAAAALREGRAHRLLLADEVGLGKTVQAGLAVAALAAIGEARRTLVLTPPGLRDQWVAELSRLFDRESVVADPARLRRARRELPPHVNPWSTWPTTVASLDFVKQPEVLAAACGVPWDVVIIDEAHILGASTDRFEAAHALARRAAYVLLLTATPHGGRDEAFAALCAIGRVDGEAPGPVALRRSRTGLGLRDDRRRRLLAVRLTAAERRLHDLLHEYAVAVWRAAAGSAASELAMTLLLKRAASSAYALHRSVCWRLRLLEAGVSADIQCPLPFDEPGEREDDDHALPAALGVPGLADRGRELRVLRTIADHAAVASRVESKLERVCRLIARTHEPVLVFTEYRDTLERARRSLERIASVAVLHGGLQRAERRAALDAFTCSRARVLLATDVAGEGLNLQATCRLVVSLELPWTPSRLEQRLGRVDRIGQRRRVHGLYLIARDTSESLVLERLAARMRRVRHALGEHAGDDAVPEAALAAAALGLPPPATAVPAQPPALDWLGEDAVPIGECARAEGARRLHHAATRRARAASTVRDADTGVPLVRVSRALGARLGLRQGVVLVFEVQALSRAGTVAGCAVVPVHVELAPGALAGGRPRELATALMPSARGAALARALATELEASIARHTRWAAHAHRRESALLDALRRGAVEPPVQPGLFETRAVQAAARREADRRRREDHHTFRLERLDEEQIIEEPDARPILAIVVR
jgi:superfamily II DNA or RNA helicase